MLAAVLAVVGLQLNGWFRYADFEHAGGDVVGRRHDTKAEIVHVGPLYDPRGAACALRRVHGCYYCANATRSLATCTQTLERAGA